MRDEPPTSSTELRSEGASPADCTVRARAPIVDSMGARTISSKPARVNWTSKCRPGRNTGMTVSVSSDSASLARTQS